MQLSIIIVNYNVKYFLEQCLFSVAKAIQPIQAEVWVVDNASTDGSIAFLQQKFPWVNVISNEVNVGFAKANNQALHHCSGEYVLFLNPDTILPEDCLENSMRFISAHPQAGSMGIRMVDGSGSFLPESKRSFPSPLTSFFKLVGLNGLFPTSKLFGRYSLGFLNEFDNHEVDVLAGAFIIAPRPLLLALKGFDETFFMYGEDVDLSYRIQAAGYKNYYFSGSSIIHFKGESTKKGSLNYVRMFYKAMSIFVKKHYGGGRARIFSFLIQLAILFRAAVSAIVQFTTKIGLPLFDAIFIFGSFHLVNILWVSQVRNGDSFNLMLVNIALPGFTIVYLLSATLAGMYDNKYKPAKAFYAAIVATVVMLAVYSLLPERYRFSRGVILFGGLVATLMITSFRWLLKRWGVVDQHNEEKRRQQTVVVGTPAEYAEVKQLLEQAGVADRLLGRIAANGTKEDAIASLDELVPLVNSIDLREVIFVQGHLTYEAIIQLVQQLPANIAARFHAYNSSSIVGSDSKDTSGEFVSPDGKSTIVEPYQKRMKRLVDIAFALFIIFTFPIHVIMPGGRSVAHALSVLLGRKTWIAYSATNKNLPPLKPGVLDTLGKPQRQHQPATTSHLTIDEWYARHYHWTHDVKMIIKNYRQLGTKG